MILSQILTTPHLTHYEVAGSTDFVNASFYGEAKEAKLMSVLTGFHSHALPTIKEAPNVSIT